jgi:hypothetical protein
MGQPTNSRVRPLAQLMNAALRSHQLESSRPPEPRHNPFSSYPVKTLNPEANSKPTGSSRKQGRLAATTTCSPRRRKEKRSAGGGNGEASDPVAEPGAGGEAGAAQEEPRRHPAAGDHQAGTPLDRSRAFPPRLVPGACSVVAPVRERPWNLVL